MSKRLLQINTTANCGSTGRLAKDIGDVAIAHGWESWIAYGRDVAPGASHLIKVGSRTEVLWHVLMSRLFDLQGFASRCATKRLIREIREIKPDVIQMHNIHGYYLNMPVLFNFIAESKIPVVWSLHDCWTMTGHCAHFANIGCEKWQTECSHCPLKGEYPASLLTDGSQRNYRRKKALFTKLQNITMVSASHWLGGIIGKSYLAKYPLRIIPNGIDTEIYAPQNNGAEIRRHLGLEGKFVLIGVGTAWTREKGLYDYYELRKKLSANYAIVLVGMTDKQIAELPEGIVGLPRTKNPHELAELYSMADVLMSLSYLEAFGLTPVEGYACGTPAIVYDRTSTPELITPSTGYVAHAGDIEDVKQKVEALRTKGKAAYTEACRAEALAKYRREDRFGDYIELYENILNTK